MKTIALLILATIIPQNKTFTGTITLDTSEQVKCEKVEIMDVVIVTDDKTKFAIQLTFKCLDKKISM